MRMKKAKLEKGLSRNPSFRYAQTLSYQARCCAIAELSLRPCQRSLSLNGRISTGVEKAADAVLKKCMAIRKGERVLVITDKNLKKIGDALFEKAKEIAEARLSEISVGKSHGEEPCAEIAKKMMSYDVILMPTTKSLSHTNARKKACAKGARIASMPGITEEMMARAIDIDYSRLKQRIDKIAELIDKGSYAQIKNENGTDINFSVKGRKADRGDCGIYSKKGLWGNLPAGEVFIAPIEGTAEGKFVDYLGRKVEVCTGYAKRISGKNIAEIKKMLADAKDKNAYNVAEFGVGANEKAKLSGNVLEDEKVLGTCHIALGSNFGFGGKINVPVHIDFIIDKPTIFIDGKIMMERGRLQV